MRQLTKSFVRLSWALSVFGLQQMRTLVREAEEGDDDTERDAAEEEDSEERIAAAMDSVSRDTGRHFERRTRSLYEAGDRFQSELVDLVFDTVHPDEWRPRRVIERAAKAADRSAETLRDWAREIDRDDAPARDAESEVAETA